MNLTPLERAVLDAVLEGDGADLAALRQQAATVEVRERHFSGVGFFTHFEDATDAPAAASSLPPFGDIVADIEGTPYGAGFLLFIREGRLDMLEGYSYGEPWPDNVGHFVLHRAPDPKSHQGG